MVTRNSKIRPIPLEIKSGVKPYTDSTALATDHYVMTQGIRMFNGVPRKIGGWESLKFQNDNQITGYVRSLYSTIFDAGYPQLMIGSNEHLYNLSGNVLTNITPFQETAQPIGNVATHYYVLTGPVLNSTNGSYRIIVNDPNAPLYRIGDEITLSGATSFNGVSAALLNAPHIIRQINATSYGFDVNDQATATGIGGGSPTVSSGLITITDTNHGLTEGSRVKLEDVAVYAASTATVASAGTGYSSGNLLTMVGGTFTTAGVFSVSSTKAVSVAPVAAGTGYAPGGTLTAVGGTFTTAATATISNTKVVSATIAAGGTGGSNGTQTVTGTTGTGTKFQASVTVSGGAITAVLSITVGGVYTVNPTLLTNEPVTGAGLSGAALNVVMGVNAVALGVAGNYTNNPANPVATTGTGSGATLDLVFGVNSVTVSTPGSYSVTPANNVSTTDTGTGATLTVTYAGTGNIGGISSADINSEFIIRNVTANAFDVMTQGTSTSQTSSASGEYYPEIAAGPSTEYMRTGYGAGLYGAGLYGAPGVSTVSRVTPRIWYFDKFGEKVLMTAGDKIYEWGGQTNLSPNILAGAPDEVAYMFVSDNILVTLGAGGVGNHIFASDQGNASNFVGSSLNQVFEDYIEGASPLISHAPVSGQNLIFSRNQTYTFRYIGLEAGVWQIKKIDANIGIIAPLARVSVNGKAYWMGFDNFYMYRGNNVEVMPANTQEFTTLLEYVFGNINRDQLSKCFAWFNQKYNEIWFHYPTADSEEPNAIARVSLTDFSWVPDRMDRTAAEQNGFYFNVPHLANVSTIYEHEVGYNADGEVLPWLVKTNLRSGGKDSTMIVNVVPDSIQNGNINIMVENYRYPNSSNPIYQQNYVFQDTDENIPVQLDGHFWQYTITGEVLDQNWIMGQWYEYVQMSSPE